MPDPAAVPTVALRTCPECATVLNRYNTGRFCSPCDQKRRDTGDLNESAPSVSATVTTRPPGAGALPRRGFRKTLAYLEETRARMLLRDGETADVQAFNRVIGILEAEARASVERQPRSGYENGYRRSSA